MKKDNNEKYYIVSVNCKFDGYVILDVNDNWIRAKEIINSHIFESRKSANDHYLGSVDEINLVTSDFESTFIEDVSTIHDSKIKTDWFDVVVSEKELDSLTIATLL